MRELTPESIPEGWTAHEGGPCPVSLDSRPEVMWSNGATCARITARIWAGGGVNLDLWQTGGRNQIIAYREEPIP